MGTLFDDGKEEGALRTIGEVSAALGIKTHVLRYWEQQFPVLDPLKRSGGRRYYRPEDVELVQSIDRLVNTEGYTLKGAAAALKDDRAAKSGRGAPAALAGSDPSASRPKSVAPAAAATEDTLAKLKSIRKALAEALED